MARLWAYFILQVAAQDRYTKPAFFDYDCTLPSSDWTEDWNALHEQVAQSMAAGAQGFPNLEVPPSLLSRLVNRQTAGECPLGVLYFTTVAVLGAAALAMPMAVVSPLVEFMEEQFTNWPFFVVAASRWPTFQVLRIASQEMKPFSVPESHRCPETVSASGIDWVQLKLDAATWGAFLSQEDGDRLGDEELAQLERRLREVTWRAWGKAQDSSQRECSYGFMYLLASRAVALSTWDTGFFEDPARAVDHAASELQYHQIAVSGWPTVQKLALSASFSGGGLFSSLADTHPKKKLYREFSDLQLTAAELCPFGCNASGWALVDTLAELHASEWLETVPTQILAREGLRPVFSHAVAAIVAALNITLARRRKSSTCRSPAPRAECGHSGMTAETCVSWGCCWAPPEPAGARAPWCFYPEGQPRRKLLLLSPVWGQRWAGLVEPFAQWAARLRLPGVLLVAMGAPVREACAHAELRWRSVACWAPLEGTAADSRGSLLQRHVLMHLLLHLGLDVLSFDFDTFLFRSPARRVEETAEALRADVLLSGHFDADCLNTGAIYLRASAHAAEWYSGYLAWLHAHPYEDEQRGLNVLLNHTAQRVSFRPASLPAVRGGALEDADEFASSRGGWLGNWSRLHFFHFVAPVSMEALPRLSRAEEDAAAGHGPLTWQELKVVDLKTLYAAALGTEEAERPLPERLRAAVDGSNSALARAKETMELYRVERAPARTSCW